METTTDERSEMTFNQQLIVGLWKIRNRDSFGSEFRDSTRRWLHQCVDTERSRQTP